MTATAEVSRKMNQMVELIMEAMKEGEACVLRITSPEARTVVQNRMGELREIVGIPITVDSEKQVLTIQPIFSFVEAGN